LAAATIEHVAAAVRELAAARVQVGTADGLARAAAAAALAGRATAASPVRIRSGIGLEIAEILGRTAGSQGEPERHGNSECGQAPKSAQHAVSAYRETPAGREAGG